MSTSRAKRLVTEMETALKFLKAARLCTGASAWSNRNGFFSSGYNPKLPGALPNFEHVLLSFWLFSFYSQFSAHLCLRTSFTKFSQIPLILQLCWLVLSVLPIICFADTVVGDFSQSPGVLNSNLYEKEALLITLRPIVMTTVSGSDVPLPTRFATSTITVSTTVMVLPTPLAVPVAGALPSDMTNVAQSAVESTTAEIMSSTAQLGMGFGITFGSLFMVAVVSIFVWYLRNRVSREIDDGAYQESYWTRLARVLTFRKHKDNKDDPEWSIESVEKVSIIGNLRAQSVSTASRSDSRGSGRSTGGDVLPFTMPKRKMSMALASHPYTSNYTAFPIPPLEVQSVLTKDESEHEEPKAVTLPPQSSRMG